MEPMKTSIIILFSLLTVYDLNGQTSIEKENSVQIIEGYSNLYRYQNFYLGGQPTIEELRWLKLQGVTKIINLRSEEENKVYSDYAYNEKSIAEELGFEYINIPVDGTKDYTAEKLEEISNQLSTNDKLLLHCNTAGRVTNFFMAYLIKSRGFTINKAVELGKKLKYSNPLEQLLGIEINMEVSKDGFENKN
jgi:protein tyrosine phosphatase (PTP) superfamily phosphohydrolase (DUF442 family)